MELIFITLAANNFFKNRLNHRCFYIHKCCCKRTTKKPLTFIRNSIDQRFNTISETKSLLKVRNYLYLSKQAYSQKQKEILRKDTPINCLLKHNDAKKQRRKYVFFVHEISL